MRTGLHGGSFAAACVVFALVIGASPVAAGGAELPSIGTSGKFGVFGLVDTVDYAGARCIYVDSGGNQLLDRIKVRPPIVYARDRGPGTDKQNVVTLFDIWTAHDVNSDIWQKVYASPVQAATATDSHNAKFKTLGWKVVRDVNPDTSYLVRVGILWLPKGSRPPTGSAAMLVKHYLDAPPSDHFVLPDHCPQQQT